MPRGRLWTPAEDRLVREAVEQNRQHGIAGFAKRKDLEYFLETICGIDYVHVPDLAPTPENLDAFKKHGGTWQAYEDGFLDLMARRRIEKAIDRELLEDACLLCSEDRLNVTDGWLPSI